MDHLVQQSDQDDLGRNVVRLTILDGQLTRMLFCSSSRVKQQKASYFLGIISKKNVLLK
jgi:hypothetical protein